MNKINEELDKSNQTYIKEAYNTQKKPYTDIKILILNVFIAVTVIIIVVFSA